MMERETPPNSGKERLRLPARAFPVLLVEVADAAKEVTHADLVEHIQLFDVAAVSCKADLSLLLRVTGAGPSDVCGLPVGASRLIPLEPGDTLKMTSLDAGVVRLEILIPYRLPQ